VYVFGICFVLLQLIIHPSRYNLFRNGSVSATGGCMNLTSHCELANSDWRLALAERFFIESANHLLRVLKMYAACCVELIYLVKI
jgi:hypothetical protein